MCNANFVCGIFFFIKELPIEQSCAHFLQVKVAFIDYKNQLPKLSEIILPKLLSFIRLTLHVVNI